MSEEIILAVIICVLLFACCVLSFLIGRRAGYLHGLKVKSQPIVVATLEKAYRDIVEYADRKYAAWNADAFASMCEAAELIRPKREHHHDDNP